MYDEGLWYLGRVRAGDRVTQNERERVRESGTKFDATLNPFFIFLPVRNCLFRKIFQNLKKLFKKALEKCWIPKVQTVLLECSKCKFKGLLNSWVVSHSALIIGSLRHALGHELQPWWQQTLFRAPAQHLCFIHDSIWFIWFDTIICLSNLSCELWNRKLKIK